MSLTVDKLCWGHAIPTGGWRQLFRGFDLQCSSGQFLVIIGGNGSGKSTLLNLLAGSLRANSGSICLEGRLIGGLRDYRRAQRIGRVMQNPLDGTCPGLSIAENLRLAERRRRPGLSLSGLMEVHPNRADKRRYRDLLEQLGLPLADRLDTLVGQLSGGQRQTISLVMATLGHPQLLLLDEHTAALDPRAEAKVMELTERLIRQTGTTALMVTHNLEQALHYGDRLVMLQEGALVGDWSAAERQQLTAQTLREMYGTATVQRV